MSFLRVAAPGLVPAGFGQGVLLAVLAEDQLADLAKRGIGDRHRVGPHVGDEPDRALAREVDTFIEALRDLHGPARAEPQLARGLLLQGRGGERRGRRALALLALDAEHPIGSAAQPLGVRGRLALGAEHEALLVGVGGELALGRLDEPCQERLLGLLGRQAHVDAPVLDRVERVDLALALDDQPHGDRLHPPGRQARLHALPQQRRDLVADQPVEDSPGLLGVEQVRVDPARVGEGVEDGVAGDLGECHAGGPGGVLAEQDGHVVGDRLALAIEVGCEHEAVGRLHGLLQPRDVLLGPVGHDVLHLEVLRHVDAELRFGQVADMPVGGPDQIVRAQVLLDGLRLGGRLDHDQCLRHTGGSFTR